MNQLPPDSLSTRHGTVGADGEDQRQPQEYQLQRAEEDLDRLLQNNVNDYSFFESLDEGLPSEVPQSSGLQTFNSLIDNGPFDYYFDFDNTPQNLPGTLADNLAPNLADVLTENLTPNFTDNFTEIVTNKPQPPPPLLMGLQEGSIAQTSEQASLSHQNKGSKPAAGLSSGASDSNPHLKPLTNAQIGRRQNIENSSKAGVPHTQDITSVQRVQQQPAWTGICNEQLLHQTQGRVQQDFKTIQSTAGSRGNVAAMNLTGTLPGQEGFYVPYPQQQHAVNQTIGQKYQAAGPQPMHWIPGNAYSSHRSRFLPPQQQLQQPQQYQQQQRRLQPAQRYLGNPASLQPNAQHAIAPMGTPSQVDAFAPSNRVVRPSPRGNSMVRGPVGVGRYGPPFSLVPASMISPSMGNAGHALVSNPANQGIMGNQAQSFQPNVYPSSHPSSHRLHPPPNVGLNLGQNFAYPSSNYGYYPIQQAPGLRVFPTETMANQYISTPYGQTPLTAKGAAISVYPHPAVAQAPIPPYGSQTSETIDLTGSMAPPAEGAGVQESELPTGQFGFEMSSSALAPLNPDGIEPTAIADVGNEMATVGQCTSADQLPIPISDELVTDDQTIGDIAPSPSCVFEADYQPFMGYDAEHQEAGGLQKQISETLEGLMPPPTIAPSKLAQQLVQTEQAAGHQAALAAPVPSAIDPSPVAPGPAPPALDAGPVHVAYPTQGYGQGGDGVAIGYNPMVFDARAMSDQIGNGGVYLRPSGTMTHKTTQAIGNVPAHLSTAEAYATGDDPHEEKVLNNRALKKARDPRCDPKRVYKTKIPQLLPWGPTNTEGKHKYQYTKHGQLAAGQTLTAEEILYYINHRKRHGNFVIWIQNAPSQCAARQDEDDKKCRYSKCPLAKRSISSGWLRAAFDEFPHLTSDGTKDPFKVAILLHLWCLEQICDVFSLFQDGVLRADNRVFPKEAVNAMTLDRDVNRAAVRDAFDPWMRIQLEELVNNNCCSSWPRPHELSLSFELIAHHIGNQTTARQRARYLRNLNKPAGHHKTIDVHMGNLGLYVGIATTSRNEKRAARSQALIQLEEQNEETKVLVGDVADAVADAVAVADADADADVDADGEFVDGDEGLVGNIDVVDQDEPASRELQEGDRRGEVGTNPKSTSRSTKGATRKKANARTKRRKADTLLDEGADDGGPGEEWIDLASPNSWKGSKDLVAAVDLSPYSDPVAHFSNALPAGIFYSPSSGIMRGSIVDAGIRERARRESVASSLRDEDQDSSSRKRRRDGECDEPGDESMSKKQRSDENYASVDDGDGAPCKKRRREETIDAMTTTTTIVKKARLSKDEESSGESDGAPTGQHGTSRSRSEFGSLFGSPSDAGLDTGAAACPTPREKAFSPARAAADKRDGGDGPENGDGRQASGEPRDETR